jgi:adenylate cyclase
VAEPADDLASETGELTLAQVAAGAGVSPATVKRWVDGGLIPGYDGRWTPAGAAYARVVARLRARGHTLAQIKQASDNGQLAVGPLENLLSRPGVRYSLRDAARLSGLDADMIQRVYAAMGLGSLPGDGFSDEDLEILKYGAAVFDAGFPLPAFLQVMRVYGQAMAQIADAEVRLIHLYVHEPLMRAGVASVDIANEMEGLMRDTLPFSAPFMNYLHDRLLAQFVEQDMIGHMEADLGSDALEEGRVRMAIAFADLAGYARLTVERGDEAALDAVERFVGAAGEALPVDARVIKTLGDEVMVVGSDASALTRWAVDLQQAIDDAHEPAARIGIHFGEALYRDGDYYGREVNRAARVVARAAGREVLVTRPVVEAAGGVDGLDFERIGEVRLKGFSEPTELFVATARTG